MIYVSKYIQTVVAASVPPSPENSQYTQLRLCNHLDICNTNVQSYKIIQLKKSLCHRFILITSHYFVGRSDQMILQVLCVIIMLGIPTSV